MPTYAILRGISLARDLGSQLTDLVVEDALLAVGQRHEAGVELVELVPCRARSPAPRSGRAARAGRCACRAPAGSPGRRPSSGSMISYVVRSLRKPSWWMPASCANALRADDRLVRLHADADDLRQQLAGRDTARSVLMPVVERQPIAARLQHHHDLFERAVARALADAVDGALDLARAVLHGGQRVGDRQAQVVVAVDADDGRRRRAPWRPGRSARRTPRGRA